MRIRGKIDPWLPLIASFILKRDDGQYTWVKCRYERVFKICKRCGIIGQARSQCQMDMFDIEELLRDQAYRIRVQYPMEFALDLMEVMYTDDIGAFRKHPSRSNLRFVDVEEGYSGWTNAEIISMDWEPAAPCNMDCDDYQNFCVELFLVNNPEAYEDSSETRWNGHSHFHVGESSGTTNDPDEIQITTGILTRMEQAVP
ncbi:hypothetical protein CMV_015953 [Castanea mollissima]|uniref:Uncharacterized protein n=1 Tax=Castanea mollissima TaxID=60419 RepID=A0A8J4R4I2_9ROSI|nr:hypothetical protein CMV_015953 [Castanea mollissima]